LCGKHAGATASRSHGPAGSTSSFPSSTCLDEILAATTFSRIRIFPNSLAFVQILRSCSLSPDSQRIATTSFLGIISAISLALALHRTRFGRNVTTSKAKKHRKDDKSTILGFGSTIIVATIEYFVTLKNFFVANWFTLLTKETKQLTRIQATLGNGEETQTQANTHESFVAPKQLVPFSLFLLINTYIENTCSHELVSTCSTNYILSQYTRACMQTDHFLLLNLCSYLLAHQRTQLALHAMQHTRMHLDKYADIKKTTDSCAALQRLLEKPSFVGRPKNHNRLKIIFSPVQRIPVVPFVYPNSPRLIDPLPFLSPSLISASSRSKSNRVCTSPLLSPSSASPLRIPPLLPLPTKSSPLALWVGGSAEGMAAAAAGGRKRPLQLCAHAWRPAGHPSAGDLKSLEKNNKKKKLIGTAAVLFNIHPGFVIPVGKPGLKGVYPVVSSGSITEIRVQHYRGNTIRIWAIFRSTCLPHQIASLNYKTGTNPVLATWHLHDTSQCENRLLHAANNSLAVWEDQAIIEMIVSHTMFTYLSDIRYQINNVDTYTARAICVVSLVISFSAGVESLDLRLSWFPTYVVAYLGTAKRYFMGFARPMERYLWAPRCCRLWK
ncbi:hypothetical protein H8356DRAFT_1362591, partial [Neocallimastix lanati (nom. inval.)]